MNIVSTAHTWRSTRLVVAAAIVASVLACSPGTLPGNPSPILVGGGGASYNGQITYRRLGGNFAISEAPQAFEVFLVVRGANQITGRFESSNGFGTVAGTLTGDLANGTFDATALVQTNVTQVSGGTTCEGQGQIRGILSGRTLTWTTPSSIAYSNCAGLMVTTQAQATAVSPIPGTRFQNRANVVITIAGGTRVVRGTCNGGVAGYPFTVEMLETSGINVTFDETFRVEDGRNPPRQLEMPFTTLEGGSRRTYDACSPSAGTYQAFFSGTDANANRFLVASPIVTFVP